MVTATEAARMLGMRKQRMYECIKRGVVSVQRYGPTVMVDPDVARQELEQDGYFFRSDVRKRAQALKKRPVARPVE
jgi:hypothetical protein